MKTIAVASPLSNSSKALLWCGPASSAWYIAMNVYVPMKDPTYNWVSQTVSELSAIGAPTRPLWVNMGWIYTLLLIGFACGLLRKNLLWVGVAMLVQGVLNPFWPPMHLRPVLASDGGDLSDTLHIAFTVVWGILSLLAMGFGAASLGRKFQIYTLVSGIGLLTFGFLTGQEAPRMQANLLTPLVGVWERINIALFMVWVFVFALAHLRKDRLSSNCHTS